jgi:hypothetical protein
LKSGEEQAGQARFVRVAPCRSRSTMRFMCSSSVLFRDKFLSLEVEIV